MCEVTIRSECGEFLTIGVLGRFNSSCTDYWDGNWVSAVVKLAVGGFRGSLSGTLRTEELARSLERLVQLQELLQGTAEFETMEEWLSIRATGDGCGHMEFQCVVRDQPGIGNTLEFLLSTDQTFTRSTVAELVALVQAFPVIGSPGG